jgi:hypothetical protein
MQATPNATALPALWSLLPQAEDIDIPPAPQRLNRGLVEALKKHVPSLAAESIIVEIGAELGGSTRLFLEHFSNAQVVSIDPWPVGYNLPAAWGSLKSAVAKCGNSLLPLYLHYCKQYRNRVTPVREFSSDGLIKVYNAGLKPSLFYVDGDHTYHGAFTDLALINSLFPDTLILGDDWSFTSSYPRYRGIDYSVQKAATDFAAHTSRPLDVISNTYAIGVRAADTTRYA